MSKIAVQLTPDVLAKIQQVGSQIRLARLRRNIPITLVCARSGLSRQTVVSIEKGSPTVSMGAYAAVMHSLQGLDRDLLLLAKDDRLGHMMQDAGLEMKRRASKK
jgi:transcriptional regulator with XRE-family HTH domain